MLIVDMNEIFICSDFQVGYMLDQSMCSMKASRVQGTLRGMFKKNHAVAVLVRADNESLIETAPLSKKVLKM